MPAPHEKIVMGYAETTAISPRACLDVQAACKRFLADLQDSRWDFRTDMAESIIEIIETLFCHQQGEDLSGPYAGQAPDSGAFPAVYHLQPMRFLSA